MKYIKSLIILSIITSCAGTGSSYDPIVDTVKDGAYQQTLSHCQKLSEQRSYVNGDTKTSALAGGGIGAIVGGIAGKGLGGAAIGALAGSTIGGGTQALQTKEEKKYIIVQCLRGYGYNVIL